VPSLPKAAFILAVLVTAGLAIAAVVAAATSGDDSPAATSPPSTVVASATSASAAPAGEAAATIVDFAFDPDPISVKVGQSVTWTNADAVDHSVKAGDGSFDSGSLAKEQAFTATFSAPGSYSYLCGIHDSMTGTVVVEP
jgi:plastocyanin